MVTPSDIPLEASSWTAFDWVLALTVVISTVAAFFRGIIRVLFSIGGWVLGVVVASWNYRSLAANFPGHLLSGQAAEVVSFVLIVVLIVVAATLVGSVLRRTVSAVGLGLVDRLLGAAFGVLRGCLIAVFVMLGVAAFDPNSHWVGKSQLAPYFLAGAHELSFVVPEHFQQQVANGATVLLRHAPEYIRPHSLEWKHSE
jgi:membrane protein required for colicin V production